MVEVVFSSSAEGTLKFAQGWGEGAYRPACVGFAYEGKKQPSKMKQWLMTRRYHRTEKKKWENAVVLPGEGRDVLALYLGLSMGSIAPEHFWDNREDFVLERERLDVPPDQMDRAKEAARRSLCKVRDNLEQICRRAASGEPIRIWVGTSGEDRCMLSWFAAQLDRRSLTSGKVYLNELPEKYNLPQGGAVSCTEWGDVEPEKWGLLDQKLRREAPADFLQKQAALWHRLQEENTDLRIVENGTVKSVPGDYFDDLIWAEIDRQPDEFYEAQLIGELIGTQLRMPDGWIASRIETMIASGRLCITWEENPGSRSYRRRLKKVH